MKKVIYLSLFIIFLLLRTGISGAEVSPHRNPNSAKGCAICHYRWIDTFFIEGKGTDLAPYHSEKAVATPEMCFSCHDGSIMDSRARMINGTGHKTDVPPPADMSVPEIFPLDESGKVQCATCHTAHGVASGPGGDETIFMRTSNKDSAMCRMCHAGKDAMEAGANHPVGPVERKIPDRLFSLGPTHGADQNRLSCETCHAAHGSMNENFLIFSGQKSALCLVCHQDKNMTSPAGRKNVSHVVNVVPRKVKVPAGMVRSGARLGRKGEVICQTCHKVHDAPPQQQLLVVEKKNRSAFCLSCHSDKQELAGTKHNLMRSAPREKNRQGKTVAEAGVCSACHLAHQPARNISTQEAIGTQLCQSCHRKGAVAEGENLLFDRHPLNISPFDRKYSHSLSGTWDTGNSDMDLPLFSTSGAQDQKGNITCATCHDPHGGQAKSSENIRGKNGKGKPLPYFLRKSSPDICAECHGNKFGLQGSQHDLTRTTSEQNGILYQRTLKSGLCGACHPVHVPVADTEKAGEKADTSAQALCLDCHTAGGLAAKKVDPFYSHPMDVSPDRQKEASALPLFGTDGRTAKTGMVKCYTCHDPHRARTEQKGSEAQTESGVQEFATQSFLRKPSPGICEDCHTQKGHLAGSQHDLTRVTLEENEVLHRRAAKYGLCGSCHPVHGSAQDALGPEKANSKEGAAARGLCLACHKENGLAAKKAIKGYSHPLKISPPEKGLSTTLPLFGKNGKQSAGGVIECYTCHDPHGAPRPATAALKEVKGETPAAVTPSFLRKPSLDICGDCHTDKLYVANSKHDLSRVAPDEKNILNQTASEAGPCGACHLVHNGRNKFLWAREIKTRPKQLAQELCLGCHNEKGPAAKKTLKDYSHPVNIAPARKGIATDLPLFDKDGKKSEGGVMSCHTCHDPHRWDPSKRLTEAHFELEGDAGNSFLRRPNFPEPLLCSSCHPAEALVEKTDHDLKVTAPDSKNLQGKTPAQSGTCGVCHLVHNSKNWTRMWAQEFGRGDSAMEMLCNGCHSKAGSAKNKVPKIASHPAISFKGSKKSRKGRLDYFPLFHTHYAEQIPAGNISCPYCHNVHQWNPKTKTKGEGVNVDGDATNSFLRAPSQMTTCKDCHGPDALFRIKNFHLPEKRKPKGLGVLPK